LVERVPFGLEGGHTVGQFVGTAALCIPTVGEVTASGLEGVYRAAGGLEHSTRTIPLREGRAEVTAQLPGYRTRPEELGAVSMGHRR
jgi:hypothetical protein